MIVHTILVKSPKIDHKLMNYMKMQLLRVQSTEAEFLDVIGAKVLRVFHLSIHSHPPLPTDFPPP